MSKSNETTPNVPTLRFKEFSGEWKKIRLGSIIEEIKTYTSDFNKYPLYSFTIENGVTPKTDRYERNFLVTKDGDTFKIVPPNSFVMNPMNLRFGAINYSKVEIPVSVSGYYNIFEIENGKNNEFWSAYFLTKTAINLYNSVATGSLIEKKRVHFSQFIQLSFYVPSDVEKQKITRFLQLIENRIAVQNKIISDLKVLKKELNGFLISRLIKGKESNCKIEDVIDYEQPTDYIVNTDKYIVDGKTPVLTANKAFFLGYTNEKEGIYDKSDCIIFDDFTLDFKYVDFPFKVKSSAIKILTAKQSIELKYFYEYLLFLNLSTNEHKRHYISEIATLPLYLPSIDEQRHVLSILNAISSKIAVEEKYKTSLLIQKKYFLNAMFI